LAAAGRDGKIFPLAESGLSGDKKKIDPSCKSFAGAVTNSGLFRLKKTFTA